MARQKSNLITVDFPFYAYLQTFLHQEHKRIYAAFKPLSKKFLSFNNKKENAQAYLRVPQYEALETYVFLKEYMENQKLWEIFSQWYERTGKFEGRQFAGRDTRGQYEMFGASETGQEATKEEFAHIYAQIKAMNQSYPNYIFALTMGLGKTILMATSIFYEFLLANKYPKTELYCHNVLVFAPDKTVLESLREIQTFDKSKVVPPEYLSWLDANLKFHFLDDTSTQLSTIDNSDYNIIITNSHKIILKKEHKHKSPAQTLFDGETGKYTALSMMKELSEAAGMGDADEALTLMDNYRFTKLSRLRQLGIYVDEAHHVFGDKLSEDLVTGKNVKSLRITINELAANLAQAGSRVVACYNYTGTPYVKNRLLPEVVYSYSLRDAIDNGYLKKVVPLAYTNIQEDAQAFCRDSIGDFWSKTGQKRVEGMLPKMAFFASSIEEAVTVLKPAMENELIRLNIPVSKILVNVGDPSVTTNDDLREFNTLDTVRSDKQFIILVGKGKEGWNCRSLFAVAMYRKAKSTVFVLQAAMRCLRQIGDYQHTARLYFSQDNMDILDGELQENFNLALDDMKKAGENGNVAEVHLLPPPIYLTVKKVKKLYRQKKKKLTSRVHFDLAGVDKARYTIIRTQTSLLDPSKATGPAQDVTSAKEQRQFSPYTLVAEVARYLNMSPVEIHCIMAHSADGLDEVCKWVNQYNGLLYDVVIPKLFGELFDIEEFSSTEQVEMQLVKKPAAGYYAVKYKNGLIASCGSEEYKNYRAKSFNVDNYCFDSRPELEMFWNLLKDNRLEKVWFTGMLTSGQTDFVINYIDPESNSVRSYYPDFLIKKNDGSYVIIEVKGDNMIDNDVVLAKKAYATQMAAASGMEYLMVAGTKAKDKLTL